VDEVMLALSRLMTKDLNLTVSSVNIASESSMQWSKDRIGTSSLISTSAKAYRILLLVLNSSIVAKFEETLINSKFSIEQTSSLSETEEILADVNSDGLPIHAMVGVPTMSDNQQIEFKKLATKFSLPCIITVPRSILDELEK
jgi:hypothetical protein